MDVDAIIDAVDDTSGIINNLPSLRSVVKREREWNWLVDFLDQDKYQDKNRVTKPPPTIMVVSGPRGVGKSTLTLRAAYKAKDENGGYKSIIWFNKQRFLELISVNQFILSDNPPLAEHPVDDYVQKYQKDEHEIRRLRDFLEFAKRTRGQGDSSPPEHQFIRRFFREVQPYLLIIDDIDEGFRKQTPRICREIERARTPNKVILTSRIAQLPFKGEVNYLTLGLFNKEQVADLVECECDEYRLARQYWVGQNREQTTNWIWDNTGGLPDAIVSIIDRARVEKKVLGNNAYWPIFFQKYSLDYIRDGSSRSADRVFESLIPAEKYVLTTLAWSGSFEPKTRTDLLTSLGTYEGRPSWNEYSEALTTLHDKRFLGYKVVKNESDGSFDQLWQLHPFMQGIVQSKLEYYWKGEYRQLRTDRLIEFFQHHASIEQSWPILWNYLDQGLTSLSWLVEQKQWFQATTFGKVIVALLIKSQQSNSTNTFKKTNTASLLIEACKLVITAADANGDINESARQRILLLKLIPYDQYPEILEEQSAGLLRLAGRFDELEDAVQNSLASLYTSIALMEGKTDEAKHWLREIRGGDGDEDVLRARLLLADHLLNKGDSRGALAVAQTVRDIRQTSRNLSEIDIMSHQLIARAYFKEGRLKESLDAYQEAIRLAKSNGHTDLVEGYLKASIFIELSLSRTPLELVGLPVKSLYWTSFSTVFDCTLCKCNIAPLEIWRRLTLSCPNCPAMFHQNCIAELGIKSCPSCETPISSFIKPD